MVLVNFFKAWLIEIQCCFMVSWHVFVVKMKSVLSTLHVFMEETQVDLVALRECNVAWNHVKHELWSAVQAKCWWENAS